MIVRMIPAPGGAWPASLLDGLKTGDIPSEILVLEAGADHGSYEDRRVNVLRGCDPLDLVWWSARGFSHIAIAGVDILKRPGPALADATATAGVSLICDVEALPILPEIERAERLSGTMPEAARLELVCAAIAAEPDVALWLTSSEDERRLLLRAGARRAMMIDGSELGEHPRLRIALVVCDRKENGDAGALAWCRASVASAAPDAIRLRLSDILRTETPQAADISIGLPRERVSEADGLFVAMVPPRLDDMDKVRRALVSARRC